jgi:hypothetical protein
LKPKRREEGTQGELADQIASGVCNVGFDPSRLPSNVRDLVLLPPLDHNRCPSARDSCRLGELLLCGLDLEGARVSSTSQEGRNRMVRTALSLMTAASASCRAARDEPLSLTFF